MKFFLRGLKEYVKGNLGLYILLTALFIFGVVFGSLRVKAMPASQSQNIFDHVNAFVNNVDSITIDSSEVFNITLANNLKTASILSIAGLSIIGVPLIFILIFFRGLSLGYATGFLIKQFGTKGIIFSLIAIFPQNIIIIPTLISIGVASLIFPRSILNSNKISAQSNSYLILGYFLLVLFFCLLLLIACLIESYISSNLIKFLAKYI